jgi:methylmalonyl-CoA/ethylmalonyl-CoA epimerase
VVLGFFCYPNGVNTPFLNHIGIATDAASLDALRRLFGLLGLGVSHSEPVAEQGVVTHFVPLPNAGTQLEFLEVTDPEGTVAQFLKKRGPGIHHLSFELPGGTLDSVSERLREAGFRLIYPQARPGAHSMRVNFVHPGSAGGVLVELTELARTSMTADSLGQA